MRLIRTAAIRVWGERSEAAALDLGSQLFVLEKIGPGNDRAKPGDHTTSSTTHNCTAPHSPPTSLTPNPPFAASLCACLPTGQFDIPHWVITKRHIQFRQILDRTPV